MASKKPHRTEEVRTTFTDDDTEVNTTSASPGDRGGEKGPKNAVLLRKIFETAIGLNAVEKFTSGDLATALILSTVAVVFWCYDNK